MAIIVTGGPLPVVSPLATPTPGATAMQALVGAVGAVTPVGQQRPRPPLRGEKSRADRHVQREDEPQTPPEGLGRMIDRSV